MSGGEGRQSRGSRDRNRQGRKGEEGGGDENICERKRAKRRRPEAAAFLRPPLPPLPSARGASAEVGAGFNSFGSIGASC